MDILIHNALVIFDKLDPDLYQAQMTVTPRLNHCLSYNSVYKQRIIRIMSYCVMLCTHVVCWGMVEVGTG